MPAHAAKRGAPPRPPRPPWTSHGLASQAPGLERAPSRDRQRHDASCRAAPAAAWKRMPRSGSWNQRKTSGASVGGVVGPSTIAMSTTDNA